MTASNGKSERQELGAEIAAKEPAASLVHLPGVCIHV